MPVQHLTISRIDAQLHVQVHGDATSPVVYLSHSILSSSVMWATQVRQLTQAGWRVVCADSRGHGASRTSTNVASMTTLIDDTIAVLDGLAIDKVHYVGLSLGGMVGFGLGIEHSDRLHTLCICDARADSPPEVAAPWNDRIMVAMRKDCRALAPSTLERWFGNAFLQLNPTMKTRLVDMVGSTSVDGFVACARAIQSMNYLDRLCEIPVLTTLIVGANDGALPAAMQIIAQAIPQADFVCIPEAGHLPNIDRPDAFHIALSRHLAR